MDHGVQLKLFHKICNTIYFPILSQVFRDIRPQTPPNPITLWSLWINCLRNNFSLSLQVMNPRSRPTLMDIESHNKLKEKCVSEDSCRP